MKSIFLVIACLFVFSVGFGQANKDITVFEKKEGDKIIVIARNVGTVDYNVKLKITSEGMDVTPSKEIEAMVPAGFMKEMATITPRPAESWSYGFDVSFTQTLIKSKPSDHTTPKETTTQPAPKQPAQTASVLKPSTAAPELSNASVVLYSKPGCGRCSIAKKQLTTLGIEFLEVSTQSDSPEVSNMWSQLRNNGFTGGSVTMPVMRVDGKYSWNIQDINGFVGKIKS